MMQREKQNLLVGVIAFLTTLYIIANFCLRFPDGAFPDDKPLEHTTID